MRPVLALSLLPLLAACAVPQQDADPPAAPLQAPLATAFPTLFPEPEPPAPPPVPARVLAALPPGIPESIVLRNTDGCYLYSVEVTDPPSGYPVRDAAGNPICDEGAGPVPAAAPLPGPAAGAPPPPPPGGGSIDITPILTAPRDGSAAPVAPPPSPPPAAPGRPVEGSITPPAPIVQPSGG